MYLLRSTGRDGSSGPRVQLLGSGTILREVEAAAELLANELRSRRRRLELPELHRAGPRHAWPPTGGTCCTPASTPRTGWVTERLVERPAGPVVAATDYMRAFAEQIRPSVPADRRYVVLGTDGFGRSDYRKALRRHFEVDR